MQLGRFEVSTLRPPPILSITFSLDGRLFTIATEGGYEIWRTYPLGLLRRRSLPGTLGLVVPLSNSPLLVLQGGGAAPLYPPNKAVIYHDGLGTAVAELEFGETIRNIAVRHATICVALSHRVVAFEYGVGSSDTGAPSAKGKEKAKTPPGLWLRKIGEWETAENRAGLMAIATAPGSTLLLLPGRQAGHVQLITLPPCAASSSSSSPPASSKSTFRSPIILAHTHALSTLACTATGSHILTMSERGTLLRVWETSRGRLERELRRGVDPAEIWGARFEDGIFPLDTSQDGVDAREGRLRKGGKVVAWSDKGTVHVWSAESDSDSAKKSSTPTGQSLVNLLAKNLPLPVYFSSAPSTAQYHLPRKNPHAFTSAVSAAATAARVPSMKMNEDALKAQEGEIAERFVVGWIEVEVEVDIAPPPPTPILRTPTLPTGRQELKMGMGTRSERRSFGSDQTVSTSTPRMATPTLGGASTPTVPGLNAKRRDKERRSSSDSSKKGPVEVRKEIRKEKQLVAITHSGDWYRLRIPDNAVSPTAADGDDSSPSKKSNTKCELVEYRRLGVGGGGW